MKKITTIPGVFRTFRGAYLSAGLVSLGLTLSSVSAADVYWATATNGDWADGTKWTGGNPPADESAAAGGDVARFDDNGTYMVTLSANRSVRSLYIQNNANPVFDFTGFTMTVGNIVRSHENSQLTLIGGTIAGGWYQGYNGGNNSLMTITGSDTAVTTPSGGHVGYSDGNLSNNLNTLSIQDGATFTTNGTNYFVIGLMGVSSTAERTANGNKVEVIGEGSSLNVNAGIRIGSYTGTAIDRQVNNNSLVIDDGGYAKATQVVLAYATATGSGAEAKGNTLTVGGTGAASVLDLTGSNSLIIGAADGDNLVTVNAGGTINATGGTTTIGAFAGNALRVFGGTYNATGRKIMVDNDAKMYLGAGGTITANEIEVSADGRFGDKSQAASAGFTSGLLNVTTMTYHPTTAFSVGDNSGSTPAVYNMVGGVHSFGQGMIIEEAEGYLVGNGTIQGLSGAETVLTVNGRLAPGNPLTDSTDTINVTGFVVAGENAEFQFDIENTFSFDQLLVTDDILFDGTLNVTLLNGFMPDVGDSFKLFDFTGSLGTFHTLNLAVLDGGKLWDTSALYTDGLIAVVIPEPSTVLLLLTCGLGFSAVSRRR